MNKKALDKVVDQTNFNSSLFSQSISLVQNTKTIIPLNQMPIQLLRANPNIKKQQQTLQASLSKTIKLFGSLLQIQKNNLGTVLDYGTQIFQELTDLIQTGCKKYINAKSNSCKIQKNKNDSIQNKDRRPQQLYSNIKPCDFESHNQTIQQNIIRLDNQIRQSSSISNAYTYVDNLQKFQGMINQLLCVKQVAVDLQHSNKSYEGFTCLIQISSRTKDYIVDVFPLWEHISMLSKIISNPKIVKVMHGAEMDTKWLQRDFNIHIYNLFDTYKASRVLGYPKLSYAFLLNHYCNMSTDKKYQLADWRQRPLSSQMLHYARLDTHYLLQIWDKLRCDLAKKAQTLNLNAEQVIKQVYQSSFEVTKNEVQLFTYKKKQIYQNLKRDTKQTDFQIYQRIFWMIDKVAKDEDECFEDLISRRTLLDVLARVKDLLHCRSSTNQVLRVKIDRLLNSVKSSRHQKIGQIITMIKKQLQRYFIEGKKLVVQTKQKKVSSNLIQKIEQQKNLLLKSSSNKNKNKENLAQFQRNPNLINLQQLEYPLKTYQNSLFQKQQKKQIYKKASFSMIQFEPIMNFLSVKYQINAKVQEQEMKDQYQIQQQSHNSLPQIYLDQKEIEEENNGVIQFKRINPNVIYTIQEDNQIQEQKKPKKKRKEHEYQERLKNKTGNIFDLLEE